MSEVLNPDQLRDLLGCSRDADVRRHEFDDDAVCAHCGFDGAEASYYSKRGYAHEYEGTEICTGSHQGRRNA